MTSTGGGDGTPRRNNASFSVVVKENASSDHHLHRCVHTHVKREEEFEL